MDVITAQFANSELEAQVLAALARDADTFWRYAEDFLVPDVFSEPAYRRAFQALVEYHSSRGPLPELPVSEPPSDLDAAVRRLVDLAQRRKAAEIVSRFWADLGAGRPVGDVLSAAVEKLTEAQQAVKALAPGEVQAFSDLLTQAEKDLVEKVRLLQETGRPTAHPSFGPEQRRLTELLGGLQPCVYALGGQPGLGKTFLALTWAHRYITAEQDTAVVWVDVYETRPIHLLALRLACVNARRNPYEFERGLANPADFSKVAAQARTALRDRFTVLEAGQNTTVAHIRGAVRRLRAQTGAKRVMVVVDYVQKLAHTATGGIFSDVRQRVIAAVAGLTELVKVAEGPVVVISSLGKDAYRRGVKGNEASLADFKEAGEVEYTVDVGIQLRWAEDERNPDPASAVKVLDCWVVKNRFGPTGVVRLFSLRTEARYTEEDPGNITMPSLLRDAPEMSKMETVSSDSDDGFSDFSEDIPF
jgi:replicative DNA helicase